jgi:hypothetical protein
MKRIFLNNGGHCKVDDEDYLALAKFQWNKINSGYAAAYINGKTMLLHRFIMDAPHNKQIDHINADKLDNQKVNLRLCSRSQNCHRTGKKDKHPTSSFIGVSLHKRDKLWRSRLQHKVIGCFKDEHLAALMHDFWATYHFKEFANTNFKIVSHN